ncbi:uncharacterized protein G2W53_001839 [Senna tora]|uniref:Uncharacterized protein n=1 Tax=Senna tora TaxID=362788 RepID=A0A835CJT0_9FABA|nr:uncharacterized protein G2W53_001839 [Senna tora]
MAFNGYSKNSSASDLNPFAREWSPMDDRSPEEHRGHYLTFPQGEALCEYEIFHFSNM